jgi:hypothetical protein
MTTSANKSRPQDEPRAGKVESVEETDNQEHTASGHNGQDDEFDMAEAGEELPNAEPGNIVDLASLAEDDDDPVRNDTRRVQCNLKRPDNFTRFRTWPDKDWWRIYHFLIRERTSQDAMHFFVHKNLLSLDELDGRTKRKRLVPYITRAGALGFWPFGGGRQQSLRVDRYRNLPPVHQRMGMCCV